MRAAQHGCGGEHAHQKCGPESVLDTDAQAWQIKDSPAGHSLVRSCWCHMGYSRGGGWTDPLPTWALTSTPWGRNALFSPLDSQCAEQCPNQGGRKRLLYLPSLGSLRASFPISSGPPPAQPLNSSFIFSLLLLPPAEPDLKQTKIFLLGIRVFLVKKKKQTT